MKNQEETLYHIFLRIIRLHHHRSHMLLGKDGIYPGQQLLLIVLNHHNGLSQKELAEKMRIAPATLTVMIRRMEKGGLLEKKHDEIDQRVFRVFLTEKGREAFLRVDKTIEILENECFSNFTVEEKILLRRLMMQMIDNLKNKIHNIDN